MNKNDGMLGNLPASINTVNPTPKADAQEITARVTKSGKTVGYALSGGEKVSREQGVTMAKNNQIKGVSVAKNQGTEYLRAHPDGTASNNLSSLPSQEL